MLLLPRCLIALILPTTQLAPPQHNTTRESAAAQPQAMHLDSTTIPQYPDLSKSLNRQPRNRQLLLMQNAHAPPTPVCCSKPEQSTHTQHTPQCCLVTVCTLAGITLVAAALPHAVGYSTQTKTPMPMHQRVYMRNADDAKLVLQAQEEQQRHTKVLHTRDNHTHTHTNSCTCRQLARYSQS